MGQRITRRSLAKRFLLLGSAFAFFGIQNTITQSPPFKVQPVDDGFVSINGWIVSKSELSSKGITNNAR